MGRKRAKEIEALKHKLFTRVNEAKFKEFQALLQRNPNKDMSSLLRDILYNRKVKVYTHDRSLDIVMEELSALRAEIRAVGININQVTRLFNTYPELKKKEFYAKIAFNQYVGLESKIDGLLEIIEKLSKKWLSE